MSKKKYPEGQFQFEEEYCSQVKGKKNKPMAADSNKNRTKQAKLRDQEDKARNAKQKQEVYDDNYFADLAKQDRENMKIADTMRAVEAELRNAVAAHGPMKSSHEGYAVILEELDELWEHVRLKEKLRKKSEMRLEAIQVAAMAARFVIDLL
jgi:hypothetical protein